MTMEHFYKSQKRTYAYPRVRLHWANFLRNLRVFEDDTLLQGTGVQQALTKCNLTSKDLLRFAEWSMDQLSESKLTQPMASLKLATDNYIPVESTSQFFEIPSETFNCTFLGRKRHYQSDGVKWQTWAECYADKPTIYQILSPMRCEHKAFFNLAYRYQFEFGAHTECMRLVSSQLDHFTLCYNSQTECLQPFLSDDVQNMIQSKPMSETELRQLTEKGDLYAIKGNGTPPPIYLHNVRVDVWGQTLPFLGTESRQSKQLHNTIHSRMEIFDRYVEETDYEPGYYRFKTFIETPLTQVIDPERFHQKLNIDRFHNAHYEFSQVIRYRDNLFRITARARYSRLNKSTVETFRSGVHPWSVHVDYASSSRPIESETFWLVTTAIYRYYRCRHDQLISKQRHIPFIIQTPVQITERMRKKLKVEELEVLDNITLVYHDGEVVCDSEDPFVGMVANQEPKMFKPLTDFVEYMGHVVMPDLVEQNNKISNNATTSSTNATVPSAAPATTSAAAPTNAVEKKERNYNSQSDIIPAKAIKLRNLKGIKPHNNEDDGKSANNSNSSGPVIATDNDESNNNASDVGSNVNSNGRVDGVSVDNITNTNTKEFKIKKYVDNCGANDDSDNDEFKDAESFSDCEDAVDILQSNTSYIESTCNAAVNAMYIGRNTIELGTDAGKETETIALKSKLKNGDTTNTPLWNNIKECLMKFVDE